MLKKGEDDRTIGKAPPPESNGAGSTAEAAGTRGGRWKAAAAAAALAAATGAGFRYWSYAEHHESTDDAFIDTHVLPINSRVSGQVVRIYVDDNQPVRKGEPLVDIDPVDFRVKLGEARAELAAEEAEARRAADDVPRYKQLYEHDQVSRRVFDNIAATADVAKAKADLARERVQAAELDLAYTRIAAPEDGLVTRKAVELRSFVEPGQALMALVPKAVWVTANFKETQLTRIRAGQAVRIRVDAVRGRVFRGHVDSIQAGTGARFSLLPPENATGNFVKVVQRVPVKIVFDEPTEGYFLAPGMSVVPVVELP